MEHRRFFYYGEVTRIWWPDTKKIYIPYKIFTKDEGSGILRAVSLEGELCSITAHTDLLHMKNCQITEAKEYARKLLQEQQQSIEIAKNAASKKLIEVSEKMLERTRELFLAIDLNLD